jgi:hypothetical protein
MTAKSGLTKDYDNEQQTINNERYSKQSQFKANFRGDDGSSRICSCGWVR